MTTPLKLETRHDDGTAVLIAAGEIDQSNIDSFSEALTTATAQAAATGRTLTVDLGAVEYLDSAAINVLFAGADDLHLIVHPLLIRILTVSGVSELATIETAPPTTQIQSQQLN
jgi:anti-anti-sigma factor